MRDLALRFARAFEGFGLSTSLQSPRNVAKERLSIILAHQRLSDVNIQQLQADVLACVQKYVKVRPEEAVSIKVKQDGGIDVFEMQIALAGAAANLSAGKQ
ncbi:hypothetical protein NSK_000739 [Nannochloropsis salina CCMP1776]|nr:hypothetical protein NSK_000739 [Nannochloropsis salina CCMP1776]|eukprot:TFJ88390.1 hypothetical protein NSK_000739 [Nannochloropsis salina CCMP1776]